MNEQLLIEMRTEWIYYPFIKIFIFILLLFFIFKLIYWIKLNKFNNKGFIIDIILDIFFVLILKSSLYYINPFIPVDSEVIWWTLLIIILIFLPIFYFVFKKKVFDYLNVRLRKRYWFFDILIMIICLFLWYYFRNQLGN